MAQGEHNLGEQARQDRIKMYDKTRGAPAMRGMRNSKIKIAKGLSGKINILGTTTIKFVCRLAELLLFYILIASGPLSIASMSIEQILVQRCQPFQTLFFLTHFAVEVIGACIPTNQPKSNFYQVRVLIRPDESHT